MRIPDKALAQHMAILGKTGSGKTSTEKLAVEQVVADDYRVCILDAIKSDWWGITSSSDGNKPGLPFKILGGPHGHVPIHSSAGAVIGQLVGSGKLPLSIIDMADFEAGGLQRFFVDFAPALMRSMRGVVYLVIEEAHEFAPKERSGIGAENMAIHWAKKIATAGRSKGIRLIVATQRVQSLHNAVLGSCETVIAHRLTTPADQEPVLKWLKANADKETTDEVARSLSSLPTGTGWICSGEARIFKQVAFPKFKTYDNAATPEKDGREKEVKTAPVNPDELRSIIGDAIKEAESNDPKRLKAKIAELEKLIKAAPYPREDVAKLTAEVWSNGWNEGNTAGKQAMEPLARAARTALKALTDALSLPEPALPVHRAAPTRHIPAPAPRPRIQNAAPGTDMSKAERNFLTVMAQRNRPLTRSKVAIFAGYSVKSGHIDNTLGTLRSKGWAIGGNDGVSITDAGREVLGDYQPLLPTGEELRRHWLTQLDKAGQKFLSTLFEVYPESMSRNELAEQAGYSPQSGHVDNTLGRLRSLELAEGRNDSVRAAQHLFSEAA